MLGHVVARVGAELGHDVVTSTERYAGAARDPLIETVRDSGAAVVINCLGSTKRRGDERRDHVRHDLYEANTLFPLQLLSRLDPGQHVIHASTDCVFAGTRGQYAVDETPDADEVYGVSKALGEAIATRPNVTILRVSIIGPERADGHGLLAWFLRQPEAAVVPGWADHWWNGVTTLDWARIAYDVAARRPGVSTAPILQPGTTPVSKFELLCIFRSVYGTSHRIEAVRSPVRVDRTLVPTDHRAPIAEQLATVRAWYGA